MNQSDIRNFAIIAHIDHGKSTLADQLMELTKTVAGRDMKAQLLDSNPIERERGITIKLAPVRMTYGYQKTEDGNQKLENPSSSIRSPSSYILNLIDTPGHVDFSYEVSRSLAACEGALLVVDATQGVQAQTLANLRIARQNNLTIIPVINKIDIAHAEIMKTKQQIIELGFYSDDIIEISAKTGANVEKVLQAIVEKIPCPKGNPESATRALVFSSQYDKHKGVVVFVRVVDGAIKGQGSMNSGKQTIRFLASGVEVAPIEIGYFSPAMMASDGLLAGEVGYIATGLKDVKLANVGDTITICVANREVSNTKCQMSNENDNGKIIPLVGYREPKPMVFVGLYPIEQEEFAKSREAMEKLRLSDSAFTFRPVSSQALGNGFQCGFLGLLHAEIVQERLRREFDLSLLATAPSVEYRVTLKSGVNPAKVGINTQKREYKELPPAGEAGKTDNPSSDIHPLLSEYYSITSASEFPNPTVIETVEEPVMNVTMYCPKKYIGPVMQISEKKRGTYIDLVYHGDTAELTYLMPLSEMIVDFFDTLKSVTEGYASLDYEFYDYAPVDAVKVDILVNHEPVDALSFLINKEASGTRAHEIVDRLAAILPRQQFSIPVQGAIGGAIIARADIKPFRKDVIAKLYGGDRTRKDKLLKKQKKGKQKMKLVGRVEIPQTAFFEVLKTR